MLNFIGIGSQKCGTTWLFKRLCMHPKIYFPIGKEAQFWNMVEKKGLAYRNIYENIFRGPVVELGNYTCGEITPDYAIMSIEQIEHLKTHHPNVRLILMIRNPIERAWSAIKMTHKWNKADISTRSQADLLKMLTTGDTYRMGLYDKIIQNWTNVFDKSQLLIIAFDEIISTPRIALKKSCTHIGVDPNFFDLLPLEVIKSPDLSGVSLKIPDDLYDLALPAYIDSINATSTMLGLDLISWLKVRTAHIEVQSKVA